MPPRAFWRTVTRHVTGAVAVATSFAILAASASQNTPSFRKLFKYSFSDFDSMQRSRGTYWILTVYQSG